MTPADPRERLQPALLDRLTDENPKASQDAGQDADVRRGMTKAQLRSAVLRDLSWLLNAVQPLLSHEAEDYPLAARSVLNFGMPPLAGQLASKIDMPGLTQALRDVILHFEPRILEHSLEIKPVEDQFFLDAHNLIEFEIRGLLWAQPVPLELLLRTQLDLEAGQVLVRDLAPTTFDGVRR
ncbi:MAG TPA: type VI secretion system baseplate subunit TssE [Burkholderiaceae bacterium]|nr:type VI secretion system baseplate subunit TssE [Burkholderiaceae bacterium]HMX10129.1 type VI secretion system baseplate subunit TssE [Burkholderiaceae bacterium]HMY98638.1 type VI secretion system baseplate subunit TssE [Burkholderiaceae bacterium]HNB43524.1 type VI secretion system baseplate subunit TssE [Burkholderiaceae bacterium]HNG78657.1 type VI secretion system baseplate subunit TssE [Burkholderiaceae bacterium]